MSIAKDELKEIKAAVAAALERAESWREVAEALEPHGLRLEPAGKTGLRVVRGKESASLTRHLPAALRRDRLVARFGEGPPVPRRRELGQGSSKPRKESAEVDRVEAPEAVAAGAAVVATPSLNLDILPLSAFRDISEPLSVQERFQLVQQALLAIESVYAHLPLKRAFLATDPEQALKLILNRLTTYEDDRTLFRDLLEVFTDLRDLHTLLELPEPQRQFTAFLPFTVAEYFVDGQPCYLIREVNPRYLRGSFAPGAEITHWNGTPIARFVELFGRETSGANPPARRARAVQSLTLRPLAYLLPPDEDWVDLTYLSQGRPQEIRLPWQVFRVPPVAAAPGAGQADADASTVLGVDAIASAVSMARNRLFKPEIAQQERVLASRADFGSLTPQAQPGFTWLPRQLECGTAPSPAGPVGYLRILTFEVENIAFFLSEVRRLLALLPQGGVIVDVRGNPGGMIPAGEGLLQFFTDRRVVPSPLQLRNTPLARLLADTVEFLEPWRRSLGLAVETGQLFSQGFPIVSEDEVNTIGRVYPGKAILLTDALCYSTTDFFAAGWKDNGVGEIIGTDSTTGAGGANVWTQGLLISLGQGLPGGSPFQPLPRGASLRLAARRSLRVGASMGLPVEGLGVQPDTLRRLTRDDVLDGDRDLLAFAAERLVA